MQAHTRTCMRTCTYAHARWHTHGCAPVRPCFSTLPAARLHTHGCAPAPPPPPPPGAGIVLIVRLLEGPGSSLVVKSSSSGGSGGDGAEQQQKRLQTLLSALVDVPLVMQTMPEAIKRAVVYSR